MATVVIIGAGLTGLSTAYHLEKQGFFDYQIFEKESDVGGLCRSVSSDDFTFDFTGHLLHINNPYVRNFIEQVVGFELFNTNTRRSFIFSHNVYTHYPFQMHLHGLPEHVITECIEGFIERPNTKTPKNYYQWVQKHFGAGLGKHFFFPYQKKIFCYDPKKLTHSWTGRFVPQTTLRQIIQGTFSKKTKEKVGYNATFLYPKKDGISVLIKKIKDRLLVPIKKNFCAQKIDLKNNMIQFSNGHKESFKKLISTMPLDLLLKKTKDRASTNFHNAHKKLRCTSVLNINLGIKRDNLSDKSWIYFPEKQFPFYRLGFPHTFSHNMTPENCSSLYAEIGHLNETQAEVQQKQKMAMQSIKNLFGITDDEIINETILHLDRAYVIYNAWREKNLPTLLENLSQYDIHSVGRYGEWKYASMQEAILDGKRVAEKLTRLPPTREATEDKPHKKIEAQHEAIL